VETLSTLDAEFLHIEDGIAHMHIAGVCVFAGPPPEMGELAGLVEGKLHQIPRYRRRVRSVPWGSVGRSGWTTRTLSWVTTSGALLCRAPATTPCSAR